MPLQEGSKHFLIEGAPEGVYASLKESIVARGGFYLITGNPDKAKETQEILEGLGINLIVEARKIQGLPAEIQGSLEDIAGEKAVQAYRRQAQILQLTDTFLLRKEGLILPMGVEDTGLYIDSFGGLPGPFIKELFRDGDQKGCETLITIAKGRTTVARTVFAFPIDNQHAVLFSGELPGTIADEVAPAMYGFAWDRVFIPQGYDVPLSLVDPGIKNAISMRAEALRKFSVFLNQQ